MSTGSEEEVRNDSITSADTLASDDRRDARNGDRLEAFPAVSRPASSSEPVAERNPSDAPDALPIGTSIKHYEIIRPLGQGGMGAVYLARDTKLGRLVAIKLLLHYTGNSDKRFLAEARATARCRHENIVVIHEVDEFDGYPYMVLEYIEGRNLRTMMTEQGGTGEPAAELDGVAFPPKLAIEMMRPVVRALVCAHRMGIVHRDLKPENIIVTDAGTVKVVDFGIAKPFDVDAALKITATAGGKHSDVFGATQDEFAGTCPYMSPEQWLSARIGPPSDIWAVGIILYELVTGKHPLEPLKMDRLLQIADPTRHMPSVRERCSDVGALGDVIDACLKKPIAERISSAQQLLDALDTLMQAMQEPPRAEVHRGPSAGLAAAGDEPAAALETPAEATRSAMPAEPEPTNRNDTWTQPDGPTASADVAALRPPRAPSQRRALPWMVGILVLMIGGGIWFARTRATTPELTPNPPGPPVVTSLACAPARLSGHAPTSSLASALGMGACARLAIELGLDWPAADGVKPLEVTAELAPNGNAKVTLALAGKTSSAEGPTPIAATNTAIAALVPQLATPPWPPARVLSWGAKDEASARRIQRAFRRRAFGFTSDRAAEARQLVETDPESPFSHALLAFALPRHEQAASNAWPVALENLASLPPGRAHAIEGHLRIFRTRAGDDRHDGGLRLLRQSYTELAEDPDVAALLTLGGCTLTDELLPTFDRVSERWPALGLPLVRCARYAAQNAEQEQLILDRIGAGLPEMTARFTEWMLDASRIKEARSAVELGRRLGCESLTRADMARDRALLALAELDPETALSAAEEARGDPDPRASSTGADLRISALLAAGRVTDAVDAMVMEFLRRRDAGNTVGAALLLNDEMRLRRLLEHSPMGNDRRIWLQQWLGGEARRAVRSGHIQVEMALASAARPSRAAAAKALEAIEADAGASGSRIDTSSQRDQLFADTLALLRFARGDEFVASAWERLRHKQQRERAAFEAALALEAVHRPSEAEKAYRLAMAKPWESAFEAVAARVRLATLLRAARREVEAREHEAVVDRVWANADPGLRDAVRRMK